MPTPTAPELWARFDYYPLTGELVSKRQPRRGGQRARYLMSSIHTKDGNQRFLVHRAVWTWVKGAEPEHTIDHINRNKRDNRIWNLRDVPYATQLRNHSGCKLNAEKVSVIKRRLAAGEMQKTIAADYGVHYVTIGDISRGKSWQEVEAG
jgi:hypothetical protein